MENIVIAGAGKGVGLALVQRLVQVCHVVAITRSVSPALEETGAQIHYLDLAKESVIIPSDLPETIDGLVYCPGSITLKPFTRLTAKDFVTDFTQNVSGAIQLIQACLPALKRNMKASVVLFSSVAAKTGMTFHSSIAASKGAVEALVRSLAAEYAPANIRFNALAPSITDTPLAQPLLSSPEKKEAAAKRHPLQRIGAAEELAALAAFLLSDDAGWITGQVISIDGGMGSLK